MVRFRTPLALGHALRRVREEQGQALVEYALLLSLVAIVAVVSVETFGLRVVSLYSHIIAVYP
jgi:Flp pilus assembly pilin Flp